MDYRKMYSDYVREQIAENANPYPTGVQGFRGGVEAERARIIALLQDHVCPACERGEKLHTACDGLMETVELIEVESE
jgi:hypothetical protein